MTCSNAVSSFFNLNNKNNIHFVNMFSNYTASNLPKNCEYDADEKSLNGIFNFFFTPCSFPNSISRICWNRFTIKLFSSKDYLNSSPYQDALSKSKLLTTTEYVESSFRSNYGDSYMKKIYGLDEIACTREGKNLDQCTWSKTVGGKIGLVPSGNQWKYSIDNGGNSCTETLDFTTSVIKQQCQKDSLLLKCFNDLLSENDCKKMLSGPKNQTQSNSTSAPILLKTISPVRSTFMKITGVTAISGAVFFGYKTVMEVDQLINPYRFRYRDKQEASAFHATVYGAATLACTYFAYSSLYSR